MTEGAVAGRPGLRPLDLVFLLRPTALVPLWIFQLAGSWEASRALGIPFSPFGAPPRVVLGLVSMTLALGGGYVLNQLFDRESDRANKKLFLMADGIVPVRTARAELAVVWSAAAACSIWLPAAFQWTLAASLLLNVTYSAPPILAKVRTPLDLVWNGLGFGLVAYAAGWSCVGRFEPGWYGPGLSYSLAVAGVIASTTILDIEGDEAAGYRTAGVVLGASGTSAVALALMVAAATVGWFSRSIMGLFGPLLSLPLMLRAHRSGHRSDRIAANQIAVAVFALIAGARVPLLLVLMAVVYLGARAYYRARFGIAFPGRGTP